MTGAWAGVCASVAGREKEREKEREAPPPARVAKPAARTPPPAASPHAAAAPAPRKKPEPEYAVRLASRPVTGLERDYGDVIHRYARLYVSADFSKTVSAWVQVPSPWRRLLAATLHCACMGLLAALMSLLTAQASNGGSPKAASLQRPCTALCMGCWRALTTSTGFPGDGKLFANVCVWRCQGEAAPEPGGGRSTTLVPLKQAVLFQHEMDYDESPALPPCPVVAKPGATKWNARVGLAYSSARQCTNLSCK
jgi:hypothetical protein